ncbi:hypothetical protein SEA_LITTLEFELLA_83 [Gordonia phage LittleFella]|nr:hypothetical protein SEA_LITTLEFELLA_83 [Gordonia phage LittleFella]
MNVVGEISEFSWGSGLVPNPASGYPLSPYDQLRATRLTDPTNPEADEGDVYSPNATQGHVDPVTGLWVEGTLRPHATQPVTEEEFAPSNGQHKIVDPSRYNYAEGGRPAHDPEGYQDGSGQEWRDSIPPNPVV